MGENCYVRCTCESTSSEIGVGGGGWGVGEVAHKGSNIYKSCELV